MKNPMRELETLAKYVLIMIAVTVLASYEDIPMLIRMLGFIPLIMAFYKVMGTRSQ